MPYDNRNGEEVICDKCADERWGDYTFDESFTARYNDASGKWCWSPVYSSTFYPCDTCGAGVDSARATKVS